MWLLDALFPPRDTERLVRDIDAMLLAGKAASVAVGDGTITALLPYRDPIVHALIIETKFHGNTTATNLLGSLLAEYLLEQIAEETAIEKQKVALVPVPLSGKRKRERGYNQVEEVCKVAQKMLGSDAVVDRQVLTRARHTLPQTSLKKQEREENLVGAFTAHAPDPAYLYIVIDDVFTTGATLTEATTTLVHAGASRVRAIALAH